MTQIKSNIPKIRFKEFSGDWESGKIENNFQVRMCKRIFSSDTTSNGEIPFYKIGTIGKQADSFISRELFEEYKIKYNYPKKGELMITCSGTVGKTVVFDGKDSYFQDSNIVWLDDQKGELKNEFLYYIISNFDWGKLNSTTIKRIYNDDLRNLKLFFPQLPEQQKIASFLSSVDEKIENIKEKKKSLEEYKKGVMQKIFEQEIRFKDKNGNSFEEWGSKKLGEICEITTGKLDANAQTENGKYRFYTCGKDYLQIDKFAFDTDALLISGNGAHVGYIHHYKGKFNAYQRTYVLDNFQGDIIYIKYFLDKYLKKRIFSEVNEGNIPYIVMSTLSKMPFSIPSLPEQQKIADFLSGIDEKIEKVGEELNRVEEFKKGLLQGMFV